MALTWPYFILYFTYSRCHVALHVMQLWSSVCFIIVFEEWLVNKLMCGCSILYTIELYEHPSPINKGSIDVGWR